MNALIKKEIRLLLPSWITAMLLASVQAITRPYDFYVAALLFFGTTLMSLSAFGRESSLGTFSSLLAQPAERLRTWSIKLGVLATAFLIVFSVWLAAFAFATTNATLDVSDLENSDTNFAAICLIIPATFVGGLWTTILTRQLAAAFWLTLLVPITLLGFLSVFLVGNGSAGSVIVGLCMAIGIYSIGGFFYARWLYLRAEDLGWSGGVIYVPKRRVFSDQARATASIRSWSPLWALFKKELQIQQVSLMAAVGLAILHLGVMLLRTAHHFPHNSTGEMLTAIVWLPWLVMAPCIGCLSVAEERRLNVQDAQLCLPVPRRTQFLLKGLITLFLGTLLGGVAPMGIEAIGIQLAKSHPSPDHISAQVIWMSWAGVVLSGGWLTLIGFLASTLAKSFLQALGFGAAISIACILLIPNHAFEPVIWFHGFFVPYGLSLPLSLTTIFITLVWLAYRNFSNYCDDWRLWRRNVLGLIGAKLFIIAGLAFIKELQFGT